MLILFQRNMMKKIIAIFFFAAYSATAFGVVINYHYCGGRLEHASILNIDARGECLCDDNTMPTGCCKDVVVRCRTDNHKNLPNAFTLNKIVFQLDSPIAIDKQDYNLRKGTEDKNYVNYHFRHIRHLPIYLSIRLLRI